MKPLLVGLLLGAAVGYWQGFGDARQGKDNIAVRTLDAFGAKKIKAAQVDRERTRDEAARP